MARKSRKETAAVAVQEADAACRAAIYVRLSVEDTHTHSVSIETQQMIIARYLEQYPEISVYDTYIDNGATGTNFHRPGFQQMLSDIEAGHVNCVIVKDLSRLGRNTIDTGYYIEQYFRIRNIRFIAVNENFDTAAPEDAHSGIIIPLRNMINEAYALDIGRKIRAQQRQAMKDGKFIGARTPYGYLKAEDDCHQLIIDPVAAVVVQRMFRWASEGAGLNTIAVRLNEAGVLTPSHYKKMQGKITHENLLGSGKWQTRTVGVILRSEVYTGDLVQGQTKTVDHRQVKADAEEWTIVRDTHEAIISREQFAVVQATLDQTASRAKAREVKAYTPNLLKGKVFCAHCGGSLHRQRNIRKKSDDVYFYHCLSQSRISKDGKPKYSMVCMVVGAIINTILDPIFIFVCDWGIAGAAWATVIGQIFSFILALRYLWRFQTIHFEKESFLLDIKESMKICSMGISSSSNQIAVTVIQIIQYNSLTYYGALTKYGTDIPLAACGIVMKTNAIILAIVVGISQGTQPIIGFNYGARQYHRVREAYMLAIKWNLVVSTIAFIAFQFFPQSIISLFGDGDELYFEFAVLFMRTYLFMVLVNGVQLLSSSFFTAIGKSLRGALLALTRQTFFLIPLTLLLPLRFGIMGVLLAGPVADFSAFVLSVVLVGIELKKQKNSLII